MKRRSSPESIPSGVAVSRDVFLFLSVVVIVCALGVVTVGIGLDDVRVLFSSGRLLTWIGVTAVAAGLVFVLLYGRRQVILERNTLQTFLDGAGDGIFAIDRSFRITLWNPEAERITGVPAMQAIGQPMRDVVRLFRERDRKEDLVFIEEAMLYGEKRTMSEPMYMLRNDGTEIPVADSAAPLRNGSGHVVGCVVIFRNTAVEKRKQAMHSEFAYASHQLRTPVTKALWALEAARDKEHPDRADIELAYAALRSIRRLVSEIVDVSELEQGMVRPRPTRQVVREVLESIIEESSFEMENRKIRVDLSDIGDVVVSADARMLRRLLHELVDNAIFYSREGGTVSVHGRETDEGVLIEVKDAGIGIMPKEEPMVFTKFFRGSNFDSTAIPGAGLGLNIAKGYADLMHGRLWFRCTQNEGCSFFAQLPSASDGQKSPARAV